MTDARVLHALRPVVATFAKLGIAYQVGGSVASSTFGHARSTLDVDLVADVRLEHADPIADALRGPFYAEPELIREAVRHRSSFNLLYLVTYFKVDVFLPKDTPYERTAFARRVEAELRAGDDRDTFSFATPEDVILHKLSWYRDTGGSDRQWSDLLGLLRVQAGRLDLAYLETWAAALELGDALDRAVREAK